MKLEVSDPPVGTERLDELTPRQIVAKLDPSRADILLSQLRPAILQPAYILVRDRVERRLFFVIRGTHSVRDTVTSLTAHPRPHRHQHRHQHRHRHPRLQLPTPLIPTIRLRGFRQSCYDV